MGYKLRKSTQFQPIQLSEAEEEMARSLSYIAGLDYTSIENGYFRYESYRSSPENREQSHAGWEQALAASKIEHVKLTDWEHDDTAGKNTIRFYDYGYQIKVEDVARFLRSEPVQDLLKKLYTYEEKEKDRSPSEFETAQPVVPINEHARAHLVRVLANCERAQGISSEQRIGPGEGHKTQPHPLTAEHKPGGIGD